jgi:hypothetical protein
MSVESGVRALHGHDWRELPTVRATMASVAESGPNSRGVTTPSISVSLARARLTRLLIVPTAHCDIAAAS